MLCWTSSRELLRRNSIFGEPLHRKVVIFSWIFEARAYFIGIYNEFSISEFHIVIGTLCYIHLFEHSSSFLKNISFLMQQLAALKGKNSFQHIQLSQQLSSSKKSLVCMVCVGPTVFTNGYFA